MIDPFRRGSVEVRGSLKTCLKGAIVIGEIDSPVGREGESR